VSDGRNLKTAWVHHYGSTHGYDNAIERVRRAALEEVAEVVYARARIWGRRDETANVRARRQETEEIADMIRTLPPKEHMTE